MKVEPVKIPVNSPINREGKPVKGGKMAEKIIENESGARENTVGPGESR
jgi:hypothetical protein